MCEKSSQPFKKLIDLPDLNERIEFRKSVSKDRKKNGERYKANRMYIVWWK